MDTEALVKEIRSSLKKHSNPEFAKNVKHYFKEPVKPLGVRIPVVRKCAGDFTRAHPELTLDETLLLSEALLKTGILEMGGFGIVLLAKQRKSYSAKTFNVFEKWLKKYISNWALCDGLCGSEIGRIIEKHPGLFPRVLKWAKSKNRWVRRASCVSFVTIARRKDYTKQVTKVCSLL